MLRRLVAIVCLQKLQKQAKNYLNTNPIQRQSLRHERVFHIPLCKTCIGFPSLLSSHMAVEQAKNYVTLKKHDVKNL